MTTNETLLSDYAGNNQPRIVVMGGSFNPPTKAHYQLLQAAMEGLHAVKGIFVPDSRPYLKRKLRRAGGVQVCFSEAERASMLECMAADDARMEVSTIEFGTYMPRTLETMCELSRLHQGAELYFLIGADKLTMLSHMKADSPFLNTIRFVVFDREGDEAERRIAEDATLSQVAGNFTCLPAPPGVEGVSSSLIREQYLRGEIPYDTLHPGVAAMLEQIPADRFHEEIFRFEDKYAFLTLKYPASIIFEDLIYGNAETAYLGILRAAKEGKGEAACGLASIDDSRERQKNAMKLVQSLKFAQHPELATALLETGESTLTYGGNNEFWGENLYSCNGENWLGKILMQVRDELKNGGTK